MSWLRIDDGFTANKKVAQLSDGEFRCWMRLLCHCAHTGDPLVTPASVREVATLTKARVKRYAELGLLDAAEGGHVVHDWIVYSDASVADKVAYFLGEHPEASANDVVRAVGGKREIVLAEVARLRVGTESGSLGTDPPVPKVVLTRVLPAPPQESPKAVTPQGDAALVERTASDFQIPELLQAMP